jgi:prepilin-type N-terminal cleavage/methylation domain-containing protein
MKNLQRGFTLVEIAIVLVIIGLLLGGVLKGQELINSARAKTVIADFRSVSTYAYGYQDRFRALPGDDAAAATHVTGVSASTGGTPGNGRIEGNWNSVTATDESVLFWQHVRLANFASGDGRDPASSDVTIAAWLPHNAMGGRIGVTGVAPITGWSGSLFVCQDNIPGSSVRQIETALDDGLPAFGSVRAMTNGTASGAAVTTLDDATPYTVCAAF